MREFVAVRRSGKMLYTEYSPPPIVGVGSGSYQTGSLLIMNFLCFNSKAKELDMAKAWKKQAETMVSGLDELGMLKSTIGLAYLESKKMPSDFGGGRIKGMATFIKIIQGKGGGVQEETSFQQSLESLFSASEGLISTLEQEIVRHSS